MTTSAQQSSPQSSHSISGRGLIAFALLATVGALGPDITPTVYFPNLDHYIPRYVCLALSVGFGISAIRVGSGLNRPLGIAVVIAGMGMVAYIVQNCLRILGW